jgi:putative ABC transport system ATP-binding protein
MKKEEKKINKNESFIKLKDITTYYFSSQKEKPIVKDFDLDIKKGDFITIVGPPGSGKSTLLKIIGMREKPSKGQYDFCGKEISSMNDQKRAEFYKENVGFICQDNQLDNELTVYENIEKPLLSRGLSEEEKHLKVMNILERFFITSHKNHFPNQLSEVEKQLISIGRAMIINPKLILADEPTFNLNPKLSQGIMELFKRLNKKGTVIIQATTSKKLATYSNRVISLN